MKKSVILLILIIFTFALIYPTAFGEGETYYKITDLSTTLKRDNLSKVDLFTIPMNCYVKVIAEQDSYYKVDYYGVVGLIEKSHITDKNNYYGLVNQYTHNEIKINVNSSYYLVDAPGDSSDNGVGLSTSDSLTLIGTIEKGETWLYVKVTQNGVDKFGAIPKSITNWDGSNIRAPEYTNTQESEPLPGGVTTNGNESGANVQEPTNNLVRVILIIGICIPAFLIIYLIFKPVKPTSNKYAEPKRREVDYEDFE